VGLALVALVVLVALCWAVAIALFGGPEWKLPADMQPKLAGRYSRKSSARTTMTISRPMLRRRRYSALPLGPEGGHPAPPSHLGEVMGWARHAVGRPSRQPVCRRAEQQLRKRVQAALDEITALGGAFADRPAAIPPAVGAASGWRDGGPLASRTCNEVGPSP
jgi:hypothetical protein